MIGFSQKVLREGRPRRAAPTFTLSVHQYPRRKCRGGPPWPPDSRFLVQGLFDPHESESNM